MRCEAALLQLCDTLRREVIAVLVPTLPTRAAATAEGRLEHVNSTMILDMMMAMAGSLAGIARVEGGPPSLLATGATASLCFPIGSWIATLFPTFEWLAMYLRRCHGVDGLSAEVLSEAASKSPERTAHEGDFDLPAFSQKFTS